MNFDPNTFRAQMSEFHAGTTTTKVVLDPNQNTNLVINNDEDSLIAIKRFINKQGNDFKNILRENQETKRYVLLGLIITKPIGETYKFTTIGLIYKDLNPEKKNGIIVNFKQDFVLYDPITNKFIFVIDKEGWYKIFPKLKPFDKHIWNWNPEFSSYVNGAHYRSKGKRNFNHHFENLDTFPEEIKKAAKLASNYS
jgi:hypothetical protein